MNKKIISLILAAFMVVSILPVSVFAASVSLKPSDAVWFDEDERTTWWMYDSDEEILTIGGNGEIPESPYAWQSKEKYRKAIDEVIIKNGVTKIGDGAFKDCVNLTDVTLPASLVEIGDEAFSGCKYLGDVEFPKALEKIGDNAFEGTELRHVEFRKNLDFIGKEAFKNCKYIKDVEFKAACKEVASDAFTGVGTAKKEADLTLPEGMVYNVDKDGKWNGGYFELTNESAPSASDKKTAVVITGETVVVEKKDKDTASEKEETNPNTGAPVFDMGVVLAVLGAVLAAAKKH